ncbi:hypothetical protein CBR_g37279 [Chara braunii]|uniref:Uncharacterized protein n=1 Tax=Chara braunii TaxID=69332 RepID=A0A388LMY4_CHABU|nr:hypothetical protein CBR_g37279 [Chara braunii]|eukprot:GBG83562.1 hypothetical protein CBR_g37279 [Chara braunii]
MKAASDRRFATLEDEIAKKERLREEAVADAEAWKIEVLQPGNERGCLAVEPTPTTQARIRPQTTPRSRGKRHDAEVVALREIRLKELNGRREAEQELKRLKEKQNNDELEMEKLLEKMVRALS